jgi:glycine cleavage system pyridoxal-binding protein P
MTVQELLLLDSTVVVPVGANKLQEIIRTIKHYKDLSESLRLQLEGIKWDKRLVERALEREKEQEETINALSNYVKAKELELRAMRTEAYGLAEDNARLVEEIEALVRTKMLTKGITIELGSLLP